MNHSPKIPPSASFLETVKKTSQRIWSSLLPVLKHIKIVIRYYLKNYPSMISYVQDFFPHLQTGNNFAREIRLSESLEINSVYYDNTGCHITLPDCCVVSGEQTDNRWITEEKQLENFALPLIIPSIIAAVSLFMYLIFWNFYILPLGILAGMIIGYMKRNFITVHLKYRKSDAYLQRNFPQMRIFGNELIVRVGHRSVRQNFFSKEYEPLFENSSTDQNSAGTKNSTPAEPQAKIVSKQNKPPKSIPLHDEETSTPILPEGEFNEFSDNPADNQPE